MVGALFCGVVVAATKTHQISATHFGCLFSCFCHITGCALIHRIVIASEPSAWEGTHTLSVIPQPVRERFDSFVFDSLNPISIHVSVAIQQRFGSLLVAFPIPDSIRNIPDNVCTIYFSRDESKVELQICRNYIITISCFYHKRCTIWV